ncbi:MAG: hypothetical protein WB495_28855 [Xanthobacteraceae bacterium]
MPSDVETSLLERIPIGSPEDRTRVIRSALSTSLLVKEKVRSAIGDRTRTAFGNATEVLGPYLKKDAAPALLKAQRQLAHGQKMIERQQAALHKKAIGEPKATDVVWVERLWALDPGKRAALILTNPAARQAALREPDLAGIDKAVFDHAMQRQIIEFHEPEGAKLQIAKMAQELHGLAVVELERAILSVPAAVQPNGAVRPFVSANEFRAWVDRELPGQSIAAASMSEQIEIELIDEAA